MCFAQDVRIHKNDVNREQVDSYISNAQNHSNPDSIYYYYNRALLISEEINYKEGQVQSYEGLIKLHEGDDEMFERLRYSLLLSSFLESEGTDAELAVAYNRLGKLYYEEQLFNKAVGILEKARELSNVNESLQNEILLRLVRSKKNTGELDKALVVAREIQDTRNLHLEDEANLLNEKAEIYHDLKAYEEELATYKRLLNLLEGTELEYLQNVVWNNIGYTQKYLKNYAASKAAFYKVVNAKPASDDYLMGGAYYNLGLIYQNNKKPDSAVVSLEKGMPYFRKLKDWDHFAKSLNIISMVYYQENDQFNAQKNIEWAIDLGEEHKLGKTLARSYEVESYILQDLFEYEQALESYKKFLSIRDSVLTEERSAERNRLFDQYRVEEFEKRLRLIWASDELDFINLARLQAEKEAEEERFRTKQKEDELKISALENSELRAKQALNALILNEERLKLKNKENELALIQRESELKELALEKERLSASEREKEIQLLAQQNELQEQIRMREQEEFNNRLRFISSLLFFLLLVILGILFAYRKLRKRKKRIEEQNIVIAQSKKEIEKEKEKSDGLLLNILPTAVAEELKRDGSSKPKFYDEVSVGFTDFSGFTMISEKLTPEELVEKLDYIFLEFDKIIERYGLQRIKTIGDAYMFASGLPHPLDDHAKRCVSAGLELRDFIDRYNDGLKKGEPKWNIRIGINTGPVVAGVIGIKKFAYDIWGDTVNTAARMESSGEVGKLNVSGSTHAIIKDLFSTEYRGKIHAKNKGDIDMYFVELKS